MKNISIICNGKEISYGMTLVHLFQYHNKEVCFKSKRCKDINVEIYSIAAFKDSRNKTSIRVFINNDSPLSSSKQVVFEKYGIIILKAGNDYAIITDPLVLNKNTYKSFLTMANDRRNAYVKYESEYIEKVNGLEENWLPYPFVETGCYGFFGKRKELKVKTQQQFDCAAYVMYIDFL